MNEIILDKNNYNSYKDFYTQIYKDLDGKSIPDWEQYQDLCYSADGLNEFLWYCHNDSNTYIFKNFDVEKIKSQKTFDDYKYSIIIEVFTEFVEEYPNNKLIFINDEDTTQN